MENKIKNIFIDSKALLNGHFLLSSGLHSDTYFQSALVLQYPLMAEKLGQELKTKILSVVKEKIETVISPAIGGLIIGHETSRALGVRAIFSEKVDGKPVLKRGFSVSKGEKCIIVEDVITTGLSTSEVIKVVKSLGADVVAVASLVDRSAGKAKFDVPKASLLEIDVKTYKPEECPLCKEGKPFVKPGSRKLKNSV